MSRRNNLATVSVKKSHGKRGKIKHMLIKPTDNKGFVTETHYHPSDKDEKENPWNMEPETNAHEDQASMVNHVQSVFPAAGADGAGDNDSGDSAGEGDQE